jgi:hypothetical protein
MAGTATTPQEVSIFLAVTIDVIEERAPLAARRPI